MCSPKGRRNGCKCVARKDEEELQICSFERRGGAVIVYLEMERRSCKYVALNGEEEL